MLETIVRGGGAKLSEFWDALAGCAAGDERTDDRLIARNLMRDLQLGSDQFAAETPTHLYDKIILLFNRWKDKSGAPERAWWEPLFLLGRTARGLAAEHAGEWVCFVRHEAAGPAVDERDRADHAAVELEHALAPLERRFRKNRMRWFACAKCLTPVMTGPDAAGRQPFDAIRNTLGLHWPAPGEIFVGVALSVDEHRALARIPTFFDSCGYPYFRPARASWLADEGAGATCPIDDPAADGVPELVVWVGCERPPPHVLPPDQEYHAIPIRLLTGRDTAPLTFTVFSTINTSEYPSKRGL